MQIVVAALLVGVPLVATCVTPALGGALAGWLLAFFFALVVLLKTLCLLSGSKRQLVRVDPQGPDALARYTVLVPLYREPAVLDHLLGALAALDYPRERLQVLLLLEADDAATLAAARSRQRLLAEASAEIVVVPDGQPRTKPRACNHGLARATGELVVVYDAEDRPEPDQLRKAALAFARLGADTICLQARLNYYNWRHNWLSRLFTLEYTAWFDLYLPGIHALGLPIPLGGTSNHFRREALRALGGWDAHNVTEDCDLGVRIARADLRTRILDSTTWEEACCSPGAWLRQRSRWVKGYFQTFFVHTRDVRALLRDLGPWRALGMVLTVGGLAFSLTFVIPGLVLLLLWWHATPTPLWALSACTLAFSSLFALVQVVGAVQRRRWELVPWAGLLPLYWLFMGLGALRGFAHFFVKPFYWDKTPHGVALDGDQAPRQPSAASGGERVG